MELNVGLDPATNPIDEQLSYNRLREAVQAAWNALPEQFLKDMFDSMHASVRLDLCKDEYRDFIRL